MKTKTKQEMTQRESLHNDIVINRVLDLPISKVCQAWTDAGEFKKWWGPKEFT